MDEMTTEQAAELLDRAIAYCNVTWRSGAGEDEEPVVIHLDVRRFALGILFAGRGLVEAMWQMASGPAT